MEVYLENHNWEIAIVYNLGRVVRSQLVYNNCTTNFPDCRGRIDSLNILKQFFCNITKRFIYVLKRIFRYQ